MGCHSLDKIALYGKGDGDVTVLCYTAWWEIFLTSLKKFATLLFFVLFFIYFY